MLKKISSSLKFRHKTENNHQNNSLEEFSINLDMLLSLNVDKNYQKVLESVIYEFDKTFKELKKEKLMEQQIKDMVEKYVKICLNIDLDSSALSIMYQSFDFIYYVYEYLPLANCFLDIFSRLIQSKELLEKSFDFIEILFRNESFFLEFFTMDGYSLVFSCFFLAKKELKFCDFFLKILFDENIVEIKNVKINEQNILYLFVDVFKKKPDTEISYEHALLFIINYLSLFCQINSNLLRLFDKISGFREMNKFLLDSTGKKFIYSFYRKLILKSKGDPHVISSIYLLFSENKCTPEIRSIVLSLLTVFLSNDELIINLQSVKPIQYWILPPPMLRKDGYNVYLGLLDELNNKTNIIVDELIFTIVNIVKPPTSDLIPIDSFLNLLNGLSIDLLIKNNFIEFFILEPSDNDFADYFKNHLTFLNIIKSIFLKQDPSIDYSKIIKKFISVFELLKSDKNYLSEIVHLIEISFSEKIVSVLSDSMQNQFFFYILVNEILKRKEGFSYFNSTNGFNKIDKYINSIDCKDILNLLTSLCNFSQHDEIDEWIYKKPINHKLFNDKDLLKKCFYGLKENTNYIYIPSFLPFVETFDYKSQYNLYLAGKFGIPSCIKFNIPFEKIPNFIYIVNRYIDVTILKRIFENERILPSMYITDFPFFPIFEFAANNLISCLKLPFKQDIGFKFNVPHFVKEPYTFLTQKDLCSIIHNNQLIFINKKNSVIVNLEENKWNNIFIHFNILQKPMKKIKIYLNDKLIGKFNTFDYQASSDFVFGDENKPLKGTFLLSTKFDYKDNIKKYNYKQQLVTFNSAYFVPYLGIFSYFTTFERLEMIFLRLEEVKSFDEFNYLYKFLIVIPLINSLNFEQFVKRFLFVIKRRKDIIENKLANFVFNIPLSLYKYQKRFEYIKLVMCDIELLFTFPVNDIKKLLHLINQEVTKEFNYSDSEVDGIFELLIYSLESGVYKEIIDDILDVISTMLCSSPISQKFKFLLNFAIASSDWEIEPKIYTTLKNVEIQRNLFRIFFSSARAQKQLELYSYEQMASFMLLFDDERSLMFAELIENFSYNNPKYIKESSLASFAFSRFCNSIEMWIYALSILSGKLFDLFPSMIEISRPLFIPVIIEMLTQFSKDIIMGKSNKVSLFKKILSLFLNLPPKQLSIFLQPNCIIPLIMFTNFGFIPIDINMINDCNWYVYHSYELSKNDIKCILNLCDKIEPYYSLYQKVDITGNLSTSDKYYREINTEPQKIFCNLSRIDFSEIAIFIASIVLSEKNNFANILQDIIYTNYLINGDNSIYFTQELIFGILVQFSIIDSIEIVFYKSLIRLIAKINYLFKNNYLQLMSLLMSTLKKMIFQNSFDSLMNDLTTLQSYQQILILSLNYIQNDKISELFHLYLSSLDFIFNQKVFSSPEFCMICMHLTLQFDTSIQNVNQFKEYLCEFSQNIIYNIEEAVPLWNQYIQKIETKFDQPQYISRAKSILLNQQKKYSNATKEYLNIHAFRILNSKIMINSQIFNINCLNLKYENTLYQINKLSRTFKLQHNFEIKSYHLASNSMPLHQSKAIVFSPFEIKPPQFRTKINIHQLSLKKTVQCPRILQIAKDGTLNVSPEWYYFHSGENMFSSPFEYSLIINQNNPQLLYLFNKVFSVIIQNAYNSRFHFYTHSFPCTFLLTNNSIYVIVLSKYENEQLILQDQPTWPISFLPFTESVTLNEWKDTYLFCGHIVISIPYDKILSIYPHLYIHQKKALSIDSLFNPNIIIEFDSISEQEVVEKLLLKQITKGCLTELSLYSFLFRIKQQNATELWINNLISNYDYLLLLNLYGGRSFTDLMQYPVFPWVSSPVTKEPRDLATPMGQLSKTRAEHYETIYECTDPHYFYGFHYSLPGIVFWLLMRLPPFTFFQWDLNEGWDDSQRIFISVEKAYRSASSSNQSDLKELIPAMYSVPEAYQGFKGLIKDVILPEWANNSPYFFTDTIRKQLNDTELLNEWIDLIFGFKQTGENAILYKNLFLPTSYHTSTASNLNMEQLSFEAQVNNFGQCPIQLFTKPHPSKKDKVKSSIYQFDKSIHSNQSTLISRSSQIETLAICDLGIYSLPYIAEPIPPRYYYNISIDKNNEALYIQKIMSKDQVFVDVNDDYSFTNNISISRNGIFVAISFSNGFVNIYRIIHKRNNPECLKKIGSFYEYEAARLSTLFDDDFVCATIFGLKRLIIWNYATFIRSKEIELDFIPDGMFCDNINSLISVYSPGKLVQYTMNGTKLHELTFTTPITQANIFPYLDTFEGRIIVTSDINGYLSFYYTDEKDYKLKLLCSKQIHQFAIRNIFIDQFKLKIVSIDDKCNIMLTTLDNNQIINCAFCNNKEVTKCKKCNLPLCEKCVNEFGLCENCSNTESENFV